MSRYGDYVTYDPPLSALQGLEIDGVERRGKFLDVSAHGLHLVFHLARAGWLRWRDELPVLGEVWGRARAGRPPRAHNGPETRGIPAMRTERS